MDKKDIKPFLRWAGSKKKLLPELFSFWNGANRYIEPFAGSARLFFHISPSNAILGDLNRDLVNCYNVLKSSPTMLYDLISKVDRDKETYYQIRNQKADNIDYIEQAARFIYLNRLCFNGLHRTNNKGDFNVPYGGLKAGNFPSKENFIDISNRLRDCLNFIF